MSLCGSFHIGTSIAYNRRSHAVSAIASDPEGFTFPLVKLSARTRIDVGPRSGNDFGHWFGALVQMFPREAFELVHGMDPEAFADGEAMTSDLS